MWDEEDEGKFSMELLYDLVVGALCMHRLLVQRVKDVDFDLYDMAMYTTATFGGRLSNEDKDELYSDLLEYMATFDEGGMTTEEILLAAVGSRKVH